MPEDRTPIEHGLAHPPSERGTIPQPRPRADDDLQEMVPNQRTVSDEDEKQAVGSHTDSLQTPD